MESHSITTRKGSVKSLRWATFLVLVLARQPVLMDLLIPYSVRVCDTISYSHTSHRNLRRIQGSCAWDAGHSEGVELFLPVVLVFQQVLLWRQSSVMATLSFCLNAKSPESDTDPRHAFLFTTSLLIQTRPSKKVLPLIHFNCPAVWYVVGRLVPKSLN